ncbi:DGQHR domain-containing protein [Meiothermus cerbereus]|uniref:DGQHR domain-containing protein n=1 Tax=Meiothermus cerbereus TaxID=65552 RepID=UPI003EF039FD
MNKIKAKLVQQGNHRLYMFVAKAGDIVPKALPDVYRTEDGIAKGYQRQPERPRALDYAKFVEDSLRRKEVIFPGTALLAYRGKVSAKPLNGDWEIEIPDELFIVDGQHRFYGLNILIEEEKVEEAAELLVPVMLLDESDMLTEAELFRVINEKAKKVRTDLARRLLALRAQGKGLEATKDLILQQRNWEVKASEIIDLLVSDPSSVWKGKIQLPNERKKSTHSIRDKSFGDSLRPLLTTYPFSDYDTRLIAAGINEFWLGVKRLMDVSPDAGSYKHPFEEPSEYVLLKSIPGVFALHLVLRYLWTIAWERGERKLKKDFVFKALKEAVEHADEDTRFDTRQAWHTSSIFALYGGLKGAKGLADLIIGYLKEAGYVLSSGEEEEE